MAGAPSAAAKGRSRPVGADQLGSMLASSSAIAARITAGKPMQEFEGERESATAGRGMDHSLGHLPDAAFTARAQSTS